MRCSHCLEYKDKRDFPRANGQWCRACRAAYHRFRRGTATPQDRVNENRWWGRRQARDLPGDMWVPASPQQVEEQRAARRKEKVPRPLVDGEYLDCPDCGVAYPKDRQHYCDHRLYTEADVQAAREAWTEWTDEKIAETLREGRELRRRQKEALDAKYPIRTDSRGAAIVDAGAGPRENAYQIPLELPDLPG